MAAEKLVDTDMDITQIAYDAGYQSQQAFSLAFKQVYLCPPGAYRKRGIYQPAKKRIQMHQVSCFTVYGVCDRMGGIAA